MARNAVPNGAGSGRFSAPSCQHAGAPAASSSGSIDGSASGQTQSGSHFHVSSFQEGV
ncbi:hypothetical protein AB0M50_53300 [Nonomuraea fuscirosea]|uniref:hypothetical protein n=1 Tax=Nonomuraea fuscirosea TaxID=1291556 RepID=UPI0034490BF2